MKNLFPRDKCYFSAIMFISAEKKEWNRKIQGFEKLLDNIGIISITKDSYCNQYLQHLLQHKRYYLEMYVGLFEQLLRHIELPIEKISLIDYGCGNGLMGIFAKYCGFKKLVLIDVDEVFVQSAKNLSICLNVNPDQFIVGDIETYFEQLQGEGADAIVGTDVIEHIYDLSHFFGTLSSINSNMVSVFSTASNPANLHKARQLRKLHYHDEYVGGIAHTLAHLEQAPHAAFSVMRKNIIQAIASDFDEQTLTNLISATRGLNKADIIAFVNQYKATGQFISKPTDATNTCNPLTSSWTERILSIQTYQTIYLQHQFELSVSAGYYNTTKKGVKKYLAIFLNELIRFFGIKFAPYIILTGKKIA